MSLHLLHIINLLLVAYELLLHLPQDLVRGLIPLLDIIVPPVELLGLSMQPFQQVTLLDLDLRLLSHRSDLISHHPQDAHISLILLGNLPQNISRNKQLFLITVLIMINERLLIFEALRLLFLLHIICLFAIFCLFFQLLFKGLFLGGQLLLPLILVNFFLVLEGIQLDQVLLLQFSGETLGQLDVLRGAVDGLSDCSTSTVVPHMLWSDDVDIGGRVANHIRIIRVPLDSLKLSALLPAGTLLILNSLRINRDHHALVDIR